jgi:toxin secretion/phage lysis holin
MVLDEVLGGLSIKKEAVATGTTVYIIFEALGIPLDIFGIFITIILIDYITGCMKAGYNKEISSDIGKRGLYKKISMVISVISMYMLDIILAHFNYTPSLSGKIVSFGSLFILMFTINEGISIIENLAAMNILVSKKVKGLLKAMRE